MILYYKTKQNKTKTVDNDTYCYWNDDDDDDNNATTAKTMT
jgi:hypothetical protein